LREMLKGSDTRTSARASAPIAELNRSD